MPKCMRPWTLSDNAPTSSRTLAKCCRRPVALLWSAFPASVKLTPDSERTSRRSPRSSSSCCICRDNAGCAIRNGGRLGEAAELRYAQKIVQLTWCHVSGFSDRLGRIRKSKSRRQELPANESNLPCGPRNTRSPAGLASPRECRSQAAKAVIVDAPTPAGTWLIGSTGPPLRRNAEEPDQRDADARRPLRKHRLLHVRTIARFRHR